MGKKRISKEDLKLLNSNLGWYTMLKEKKISIPAAVKKVRQLTEFKEKQVELIKLHNWVIKNDKKVVVLFEGRDAAGKGGAIRKITEYINPRHYRNVALHIPTEDERKQWYFQRYINQLPKPGEIVFFDRSWYNRAVVEPVNKFCTNKEYKTFMSNVNEFERMLIESNTTLIKFYFSITKNEQARRFKSMKNDPLKRWKITSVDEKAQELWDVYTEYKQKMFKKTDTKLAPWVIVNANDQEPARLHAISHILSVVPYQ